LPAFVRRVRIGGNAELLLSSGRVNIQIDAWRSTRLPDAAKGGNAFGLSPNRCAAVECERPP
jgi:hypothetical protein